MKKTLSILTALLPFSLAAQETPPLQVYTYDSFSADWGAGPKIKTEFERQFPQCKVNYVAFDNNGVLFNRVRLEGKKMKADIVLGLDNHQIEEAEKLAAFAPHQQDLRTIHLPLDWKNATFVPYDFGQYAFIYDKTKLANPPKSLRELVERQDLKVLYQDPRTSSIGRGMLIWMNKVYSDEEISAAWQKLAKHTVTITKGWTESYGAFLKGEGDLVLSHNTSPLYHLLAENKDQYAATEFVEGGVLQIEVVAKVANRPHPCADDFLEFLISPTAQQYLAKYNVMLPVTNTAVDPHIDALRNQQLATTVLDTSDVGTTKLKNWINQWQKALAQ